METVKEKWRTMNGFRRGCLLLQIVLVLLFAILYPVFNRREGIVYGEDFFPKTVQGDAVVYTGKHYGHKTVYTVRETDQGRVVDCRIGDQSFGPYTVKEISTAGMTFGDHKLVSDGAEIWEGDKLLFRGGYYLIDGYVFLVEDGGNPVSGGVYIVANGVAEIKPPDADDVLLFAESAGTAHRGSWLFFWLGVFVAVANMVSILFAEELFVRHMRWHIENPEKAEPSDWELFWRHAGWAFLIMMALYCFAAGLFTIV